MKKKYLINLIKIILIVIIFYFIGRYFFYNINELKQVEFKINYFYFLLAILIFCIFVFSQSLVWYFITIKNKINISLKKSIIAWFYSMLAKYIPGKLFSLLGIAYFYHLENKSEKKVAFCFFLETACNVISAAFVFLISFIFFKIAIFEQYKFLALILMMGFFILIHPKILNFFIDIVSRLIKKEIEKLSIKYRDILMIVFLYILTWFILGFGFYFLVNSVLPLASNNILFLTGAFSLSIIIGLISIFTPGGLGVREGILVILLTAILPYSISVIIALLARIWTTITEVLSVGLVFIYAKLNKITFGQKI